MHWPPPRRAMSLSRSASWSRSVPSPMTLTVIPALTTFVQQVLVIARLFAVGGVGKQNDVPRAGRRVGDHRGRLFQRFVDEDAAAHANRSSESSASMSALSERRRTAERFRGPSSRRPGNRTGPSPKVGCSTSHVARSASSIFGRAAGDGHGHAAAAVQGHDDRQRKFAMFAPQLHRDRQHRFQGAFEIAPRAIGSCGRPWSAVRRRPR